METTAKLKNLRISTRKVRLAANLLKGLTVLQAERQLQFLVKRSTLPLEKLLKSAVANAENNAQLIKENLYISKIVVNQGPTLKRWRARARGVAAEILKRTSHIELTLSEIEPGKKISKKANQSVQKEAVLSKNELKEKEKASKKTYAKLENEKAPRQQNVAGSKKVFRRKSI